MPLPITHGRQKLTLTIKTIGPISGYSLGGGYDGYQKKMEVPSRGYYRAYTHTNPALWGAGKRKAERRATYSADSTRAGFTKSPRR